MKKGMIIGLTALSITMGAGLVVYNCILSPRTKKKMMSLEKDMCDDFENMIDEKIERK